MEIKFSSFIIIIILLLFKINLIFCNDINNNNNLNFNNFKKKLNGKVYIRDDSLIYNTLSKNRWDLKSNNTPNFIVFPIDKQDVIETINFVRENNLKLAIKSSGHNEVSAIEGDNTVSLDVSLMKSINVDVNKKTVTVGPGNTFHDIDETTSSFGLATPLGQISSISIGGFSLGGGLGYLTKHYGLSSDNIIQVEIITFDGVKRTCNSVENNDLFWAIRGGRGFFGVVVSFTLKCYPIKNVVVGKFFYNVVTNSSLDAMVQVGSRHLNIKNDPLVYVINILPTGSGDGCSNNDTLMVKLIYFLDSTTNSSSLKQSDIYYGKKLIEQFKNSTNPYESTISILPFKSIQWEFDGSAMPGNYYQEGPMLKSTITYDVAKILIQSMNTRKGPSSIIITEVGGKVNELKVSDTAFPIRDSTFNIFFTTPSYIKSVIDWTKSCIDNLSNYTAGYYINTSYQTNMKLVFKENYKRLLKIKNKFDPNNLFGSL